MNYTYILALLCLLSVALIGFAAALVLFGPRAHSPGQRIRVTNLLTLGLLSGFFSLLPLLVIATRVPELLAFRISQLGLAGAVSFMIAVRFIPSYRLNRSQITEFTLFLLSIALLLGAACVQVYSALDDHSPIPYYMVGVTTLVIVTGLTFYRVVSYAMRNPES
ncbi:MAG: hypothetical protein QF921_06650 [Pseudomonadales bacterium]|jgi:hypothetical protein|nr:hypothetical protein [Pseudomonadales bacterium]MDP6469517.1 hypothetical protein [Pseudomonadales bacterium]MDP6827358.1 hypothetical protein [Pseudomonadales bacterium]MDP6971181.1 hypothetical protein [Pseudomonadales bacterium]|tara:strand:- start:1582 stop:2073 length:492 start_codon:yes stop_codon:yes gene_type:complete